ncbi:hypothetical protein BGX31_003950 [Mortierella sp. GBA43]|nr:hypothetical protein BGX31_003950 [Mortierella sp. GBA43]
MNRGLIVGVTIAILAVGLMLAGAFYVYRTFYSPPEESIYESFTVNSKDIAPLSSSPSSRNDATNTSTGINEDYRYVHDEDPNSPPTFMFDHSHDNINTSRDPLTSALQSASSSSQRPRR